jgi:outer membrane PBP1 activator LpoA protein
VGGIPVECTVFRSPVFPLTETSYYQAEVAAARNDALEANHASFRVLTLLADPDKNNNVDAVKAVRELKKKVDQLCKRLRCEEKKEKK